MKKKKYLLGVLLAAIFSILLLPNTVSASVKTDEILGKVSKDGKTATFKMVKPTSFEDGDAKINGYLQKYCAIIPLDNLETSCSLILFPGLE